MIQQAKPITTRLFHEEEESLLKSSHLEEESTKALEDKSLAVDEKLEKATH